MSFCVWKLVYESICAHIRIQTIDSYENGKMPACSHNNSDCIVLSFSLESPLFFEEIKKKKNRHTYKCMHACKWFYNSIRLMPNSLFTFCISNLYMHKRKVDEWLGYIRNKAMNIERTVGACFVYGIYIFEGRARESESKKRVTIRSMHSQPMWISICACNQIQWGISYTIRLCGESINLYCLRICLLKSLLSRFALQPQN